MIKNGLLKLKKDHRDYSFARTFGAVVLQFPDEYSCDAGLTMPDQNLDGLPYGCTGYTQSELCQDEDVVAYNPKYTYDKSRIMSGMADQNVGVDLGVARTSKIVYGLRHGSQSH